MSKKKPINTYGLFKLLEYYYDDIAGNVSELKTMVP